MPQSQSITHFVLSGSTVVSQHGTREDAHTAAITHAVNSGRETSVASMVEVIRKKAIMHLTIP